MLQYVCVPHVRQYFDLQTNYCFVWMLEDDHTGEAMLMVLPGSRSALSLSVTAQF